MKITDHEVWAFLLGAGLSWLATYLSLTREKRIIAHIKHNVDWLGLYHGLTAPQRGRTYYPTDLVSDEEALAAYSWALQYWKNPMLPSIKLSPTLIAAEVIICEKLLGLTRKHAIRVLIRTKDFRDLEKNLRDVTSEISDQFSN